MIKLNGKQAVFNASYVPHLSLKATAFWNLIDAMDADPAGGTTDLQKKAAFYYIKALNSLKDTGQTQTVWERLDALYGFLGGNEFKHKFNWKANANHLVSHGTVTHTGLGVRSDKTTGFLDTGLVPSGLSNNLGLFIYVTEFTPSAISVEMGSANNTDGVNGSYIILNATSNISGGRLHSNGAVVISPMAERRGFTSIRRLSSSVIFQRNLTFATGSPALSGKTVQPISVLAMRCLDSFGVITAHNYSECRLGLAAVAHDITTAEAAQMEVITRFYQSMLSRKSI